MVHIFVDLIITGPSVFDYALSFLESYFLFFQVLSALDILTKLTKREANESFIDNLLVNHGSVLFKVLTFVSAPDLHLVSGLIQFAL